MEREGGGKTILDLVQVQNINRRVHEITYSR